MDRENAALLDTIRHGAACLAAGGAASEGVRDAIAILGFPCGESDSASSLVFSSPGILLPYLAVDWPVRLQFLPRFVWVVGSARCLTSSACIKDAKSIKRDVGLR